MEILERLWIIRGFQVVSTTNYEWRPIGKDAHYLVYTTENIKTPATHTAIEEFVFKSECDALEYLIDDCEFFSQQAYKRLREIND